MAPKIVRYMTERHMATLVLALLGKRLDGARLTASEIEFVEETYRAVEAEARSMGPPPVSHPCVPSALASGMYLILRIWARGLPTQP
jgi:hypothetical protein